MKKIYDVIVPLGCNCSPALELEKQAKRVTSYPYDWLLRGTGSPKIYLESILHGIHPLQNTEHRTQNTEHRTQNTEHRTQNTEHRTQNTEHRTQNTEHTSFYRI